jgi:RNA polymerase sigma-70 factor (ECF subfamily)
LTRKEYNIAVEIYSDALFGYALKFLRNSEDANDAVQDAFEKLWKNRKKVDNEKVKSWLFTTAHNGMVNWVTKNKRMRPAEEKDLLKRSYEDSAFENRELIEKLLVTLPPIQKSVLLFRDLEGYSYQEIGEMLNLGESQVKVYLFRARKKMKKQLKELKVLA